MRFKAYSTLINLALLVCVTGCGSDVQGQAQSDSAKPNILFIFTDDQGWNNLSVPMDDAIPGSGSDYYATPNIARIADAGMRFSRAYAAAPMCGPSRSSLHVGIGAARAVYSDGAAALQAEAMTLGQMMRSAGYATAHFGKWNPGPPDDGLRFYDASDGPVGNNGGNRNEPENPKDIFGITERAIAFIEQSVSDAQPFYMQLSHFAPHMQIAALEETIDKWEDIAPGQVHTDPEYAAMMEDLDTGIGMVLDRIEELGIDDNTYVIFTSDHGQAIYASTNDPLSWGKGSLWEGGMRVPLIVSGPGIAPGTTSDVRTVSLDFFPSFAELAGVADSLPNDLDGGSLLPVLYNDGTGAVQREREELIFHFGQPSGQPNSVAASSVYLDEYKLLKFYDTGELHLYDVFADPAEQNNLADNMPAKVDELHGILTQYLDDVDATIPNASNARGTERQRGGPGAGR